MELKDHTKFNIFFRSGIGQAEKIELMEELFNSDMSLEKEDVKNLVNEAIERKDIHVLGYCLALEQDDDVIFNKEELFIHCVKKNFDKGMQLVASLVDFDKQFSSSVHPDSLQPLINHALIYASQQEDARSAIRFLVNKGADIGFDNYILVKHLYQNDYMSTIEYLIKEQNVGLEVLKPLLDDDFKITRKQEVENMIRDHQYSLTQNVFAMKELPANVTRRKV